jgi:hypothetical protein
MTCDSVRPLPRLIYDILSLPAQPDCRRSFAYGKICLLTCLRLLKERPCTRCIKRNIGHLCHDEPREPTKRRDQDDSTVDEPGSSNNDQVNVSGMPQNVDVSDAAGQQILSDGAMGMPRSTVQPASITSSGQGQGLNANNSQPSKYILRRDAFRGRALR